MRTIKRNARRAGNSSVIFFANLLGEKEIPGAPGQFMPSYDEPIAIPANVSAAKGEAYGRQFGEYLEYDKTVLIQGMSPLTETSRLWIDCVVGNKIPVDTNGFEVPWDYEVVRIAESLPSTNHTVVAVKKVNVMYSRVIAWKAAAGELADVSGRAVVDVDGKQLFAIGNQIYASDGNILAKG